MISCKQLVRVIVCTTFVVFMVIITACTEHHSSKPGLSPVTEIINPTEIKLGGNEINEDNVVITFAVDDSARKDYQSLIKEFHQQNPSITVMLVTPPGDFSIWNEDDLRSDRKSVV